MSEEISPYSTSIGEDMRGKVPQPSYWLRSVQILHRMKWPVVFFVTALLIVLIFWPLVAHIPGFSIFTGNNLDGWLATIGGLMGAIFAAGGLVIALVSVITLLSIEKQVKATFDKVLPTLEKRTDSQIEGYIAFLQASQAESWQAKEELTNEALAKYPRLPGARSQLGIDMAEELANTLYIMGRGYTNIEDAAHINFLTREYTSWMSPLNMRAIEKLKEAYTLERQHGLRGRVAAALALMRGFNRDYENMMRSIQEALTIDKTLLDYFREPKHLTMLTYACEENRDHLEALGKKLDHDLPLPTANIITTIENLGQRTVNASWYVLDQTQTQKNRSEIPTRVYIYATQDSAGRYLWQATAVRIRYPQHEQESFHLDKAIPIGELIAELNKRFFFICRMDF